MEIRVSRSLFALIAIIAGIGIRAANVPDGPGTIQGNSESAQPLTWLKTGDYASLDRYYSKLQRDYESGTASHQKLYGGFRKLYQDSAANEPYFLRHATSKIIGLRGLTTNRAVRKS
jgi:hypothetical protein